MEQVTFDEFMRRVSQPIPALPEALQLIRAVLDSQACRCHVCKGPATRELQMGYSPLFCDEHGAGRFIDLPAANWTRRALAVLKERDGT